MHDLTRFVHQQEFLACDVPPWVCLPAHQPQRCHRPALDVELPLCEAAGVHDCEVPLQPPQGSLQAGAQSLRRDCVRPKSLCFFFFGVGRVHFLVVSCAWGTKTPKCYGTRCTLFYMTYALNALKKMHNLPFFCYATYIQKKKVHVTYSTPL